MDGGVEYRGAIEARAMVTRRIMPLTIDGRMVHQIGMPFHWSFSPEKRWERLPTTLRPSARTLT